MKKLYLKTFLLLGLIILYKIILVSIIIFTSSEEDYNNFLGKTTGKPRIIIVGSSNVGFNYDYTLLNKYFYEYDVIGCRLVEPVGFYAIIYKLQKLKPSSQDIIIFSLPHSLFEKDKFLPLGNNEKNGFTKRLLIESFQNFPVEFIREIATLNIKDSYKVFNKNGFTENSKKENITFQNIPSVQLEKKYLNCWVNNKDNFFIKSTSFDEEYLIKIHSFLTNEFHSKIFFRFPSIKENEFYINKERLSFLSKNYFFINSFESSKFKQKYWFNQWYHLNLCGRDLNTRKLITELEALKFIQNNTSKKYNVQGFRNYLDIFNLTKRFNIESISI